jgi:glycosyltransferase involved in cell wall biosynthesis
LKEAGRHEKSLEAYEIALAKNDANADAYLQKGHVLKMLGRFSDAYESYAKSFSYNPHGNPAYGELMALNLPASGISELSNRDIIQPTDGVIFVDVTDLIDYLRVNISLSGIQRVVANLILHSLEGPIPARYGYISAVLPDYNGFQVFSVDIRLLDGLLSIVVDGKHSREIIDRAIEAVLNSKKLIRVKESDTLLIAGAFWIYQRYDLLNKLRHEGVRISVFIHDLIQITNPEFVEPAATIVFRRSIVDVLCVSSYIITNSDFVANDVMRYLDQRLNFKIPVAPVKLATELGIGRVDIASVFHEYIDLAKEEYVLCVGTIEIRKNHFYLVKIWERLIDQFGDKTPNLVLVGKWGWEIDDLRKYLHGSDYLGGRLYIYNGISDRDLTFLYQNCLFTIYPSFAEGWGLPVGESLGYGKPCIASKLKFSLI